MKELSGSRLFVIAVVCGLIAAALIVFYMQQVEAKYRKAATPKKEVMVEVVVSRRDIPKGARILKNDLAARKVPKKFLPSNAILSKDYKKVANRTLLNSIEIGRPITWEAFTGSKAETFSDIIELGRRARTIKINRIDSFDGLLRPGDKIDLMGIFTLDDLGLGDNKASESSQEIVMPVLETVEVLEASRQDLHGTRYENRRDKSSSDGFNMEFTMISLNLTPKQIARIEMAERTGEIFAVLRNPKDTSLSGYEYLGVDILLQKDTPANVDLVLDSNGNPIGQIIGDNIVDKNGNIVGKIVGGKAVGLDGKALGKILRNVAADDPINRVAATADVVRDANGKIIGRIQNGQVVDAEGNVIGQVKNGKAIGLDGKQLGRIQKNVALDANGNEVDLQKSAIAGTKNRYEQVVRDSSGKIIGRIVNGQVVDANNRVIGKVGSDGKAIGLDGKTLGTVDDVIVDSEGKVVGQKTQVVRDASGNIIGRVVDGQVIDAQGNVVGRIDADGNAVTADGHSLGKVDSVMMDANGKVLAKEIEVVRDANGKIIGRVVDGQVIDDNGNVIGLVDENGVAKGPDGSMLGVVEKAIENADGTIMGGTSQVARDSEGNIIGRVVNGKVIDKDGNVIATVNEDGSVVDADGRILGTVETTLVDANGQTIDAPVQVVRDASGKVIGRLIDGKVVDATGKVLGAFRNGQLIDSNGNVIAGGLAITTENAAAVATEMSNQRSNTTRPRNQVVEFIAGGNAKDGITPVTKVKMQ